MPHGPRCVLALSAAFLSAALLSAAPASAQEPPDPRPADPPQPPVEVEKGPSAADRETARALLLDGREKLAAKDLQGAYKSFKGAHAIMGVPTTGLDLAKAEEALGRLVEARVTALDVTRLPIRPNEPEAFTNARNEAAALADMLAKRIAALVITVEPCIAGAAVTVIVDGERMPEASLTLPRKSNPGAREIQASAPGCVTDRRKVDLPEGTTLPVAIVLAKPAPVAALQPSVGPSFGERLKSAPLWSLIAAGGGVVALGVSVGFIADYAGARGKVADDCPGGTCTGYTVAQAEDASARLNRDAGIFIGLGVAGVAGVGAGLFGILTAKPKESESPAKPSVAAAPWVSPYGGGAAIRGSF